MYAGQVSIRAWACHRHMLHRMAAACFSHAWMCQLSSQQATVCAGPVHGYCPLLPCLDVPAVIIAGHSVRKPSVYPGLGLPSTRAALHGCCLLLLRLDVPAVIAAGHGVRRPCVYPDLGLP